MIVNEGKEGFEPGLSALVWDAAEGIALLARIIRPIDHDQMKMLADICARMRDHALAMDQKRVAHLLDEARNVQELRIGGF